MKTTPTADDVPTPDADVLIVGSGIMGSIVARRTRELLPDTRIVMVDGGPVIGDAAGLHLHDSPDPLVWARYNARVSSGIQSMYVGADVAAADVDDLGDAEPGMYRLGAFGESSDQMPAASLAWNVGGMGVHWTAATPWPAGAECFDDGDGAQWQSDLDAARAALDVHPGPLGPTAPGRVVLDVLGALFASDTDGGTDSGTADRGPQTMPMAVHPTADGQLLRTGPSRIFPALAGTDDPAFELRQNTLVTSLLHDGDRVTGVTTRDPRDGSEGRITARVVVVCADALRTPQLLFASGIRPDALGRYLNEHAFVTGRVLMDLERFGLELDELPRPARGEFATDALWLPQNGDEQPFHGQITGTVFVDEDDAALAYSVGMSFYAPVASSAANRLVFSETEVDAAGMPRMHVEFSYSDEDRRLIRAAEDRVEQIARAFGPFDPQTERALLPPGSSLHQTGTVRMGPRDDGTSVCDPSGRVWGFDNLFVAGNGVVPTPVVCNATLTGSITAIRAATAVAEVLQTIDPAMHPAIEQAGTPA